MGMDFGGGENPFDFNMEPDQFPHINLAEEDRGLTPIEELTAEYNTRYGLSIQNKPQLINAINSM